MSLPPALPDPAICEQARLSRDARLDGLFFTAVQTTGIYCRPVCPAPPPLPGNVTYYPTAAAAEAAGFRPCLRCRPELAPGDGRQHRGDSLVARALALIEDGALDRASVSALAARLHVGERQLRRLFVARLGAAPLGVAATRRLLFAKQLLTDTALPITQVALASGFNSVRRFNAAFQAAYRLPPRQLRHDAPMPSDGLLVLRLGYRPPYDLPALLDFLRARALPGIEQVDHNTYCRTIGTAQAPGWLRIDAWPGPHTALRLTLAGCTAGQLHDTVRRVRRMFDLDAHPDAIAAHLGRDARLAPLLARHPGQRLPSGWDGFEIAVRAVIGQQVSVAAARTLATRLTTRLGTPLPTPLTQPGLSHLFPTPQALLDGDLDGLGLTGRRIATLRAIAQALLDGRVDFDPARTLDEAVTRWTALPGIGPWTAQYIALRALGHPDAFPAEDLVLQKTLPNSPASAQAEHARLTAAQLLVQAEHWRPWRGYAVFHLWREASTSAPTPSVPRTRARASRSLST